MLVVAAASTVIGGLVGCGSSRPANTERGAGAVGFSPRTAKRFVIGVQLDRAPFVLARHLDQVQVTPADAPGPGYEVEFAVEVARRLNLALTIEPIPPSGSASCACDVLLATSRPIAPIGRRTSPYFRDRQAVVIGKGLDLRDRALPALRIGVVTGSPGVAFVERRVRPGITPIRFESVDALIAAVGREEIDAGVTDVAAALEQAAKPNSNLSVAGQYVGIERRSAAVLGGPANRAAMSRIIDELTNEGFFDQLRAKYFPSTVAVPLLTVTR